VAPLGQLVQEAAFGVAEYVAAVQLVQVALAVVVHAEATNLTAAHVAHVVQGA